MATFTGTGQTPNGYDARIVLYYWSVSGLTEVPVSGSVTLKLSNSSASDTGTRTDTHFALFSCGTRTYPDIDGWHNRNSNCAYAYNFSSNVVSYFYTENTNFTSKYPFYVHQNPSLTFAQNQVDYSFTFNFDLSSTYRDLSKWNGHNIFCGIGPGPRLFDGNGYVQWGVNSTATLTLKTASNKVYYYTGSKWQECEPYYYNGSSWVKTSFKYYTGSAWD